MLKLKQKISKRIHPWPLIKYNFRKDRAGYRKKIIAQKYGEPIDCCQADHIHTYMTLRCNMSCSFCINRIAVDKIYKYEEKPLTEWTKLYNRFYNVRELYFNGGEHFILKGFGDFINSLEGFNIRLFTNFPESGMDEFKKLDSKRNNIILLISYHPHDAEPVANFMKRARQAIPKGILWNPHIIAAPGVSTRMYADAFHRYGVYPTREELVLPLVKKASESTVLCKTNEFNFAPDMRLFNCLIHLLQGNGGTWDYKFNSTVVSCNFWPRCTGCNAYNEILDMM